MGEAPFEASQEEPQGKVKAAMAWLRAELADGKEPVAGVVIRRGTAVSHAERTLARAARLPPVQKTGFSGKVASRGMEGWLWKRSATPAPAGDERRQRRMTVKTETIKPGRNIGG